MYDEQISIGQKLRIRQWDDMANEFGSVLDEDINTPGFCFIPQMRDLCGKEFTVIKEFHSDIGYSCYRSEENVEKNSYPLGFWYITADMLEPTEPIKDMFESVNITQQTFFNLIK